MRPVNQIGLRIPHSASTYSYIWDTTANAALTTFWSGPVLVVSAGNLVVARGTQSTGGSGYGLPAADRSQPGPQFGGRTTGKLYAEFMALTVGSSFTSQGFIANSTVGAVPSNVVGNQAHTWGYLNDGRVFSEGVPVATGITYTTGDVIAHAVDIAAGKAWFRKNGTWIGGGNPATGTLPDVTTISLAAGWDFLYPGITAGVTPSDGSTSTANFGATAFTFAPPSGFLAWDA